MSEPLRLVIVGASDAGISAGLRARELDPTVQTTLVVADAYPNFSICGIPYWLSGEVSDAASLAHRTSEDLELAGLGLRLSTVGERIDVERRELIVRDLDGASESIGYDRLVIATGAIPARPPIPGIELEGVHVLHSMGDAIAVDRALSERGAGSAVIVGAGYIGVEMADALTLRGLDVSLVEQSRSALTTVDPDLGALVVDELSAHRVRCSFGARVTAVTRAAGRLEVTGENGLRAQGDIVLVLAGVQPDTKLARDAGASVGVRGAISVNRQMRTGLPEIWAAGDCVQTYHQLLGRPVYMPLGSTAHKQGRIAGENAIGGSAEFAGTLGTQVVKVFDLAIAATGLRESTAREEGFDPLTVQSSTDDHKAYYPGAHPLQIRIVADRITGQLLGAQILGHVTGQVAKRIDTLATAIYHRMTCDAGAAGESCGCAAGQKAAPAPVSEDIRETVREKYAAAARAVAEEQGSSSCCGPIALADADQTRVFGAALYDGAETEGATATAVAASLGCGVPTAVADLHEGETVLDLGSGAGADVLISARRVGLTGRVIGLDMTDEMLELARANAAQAGVANVEFVKGFIEDIPLADGCVDVIVSNCVLNLSGDKRKVLAEAARVLRPGGRLAVSDVIAGADMDQATRADLAAYTGCIAGALTEDEFREGLEAAGFAEIEIRHTHRVHEHASSAIIRARKPDATTAPAFPPTPTTESRPMTLLDITTPETPAGASRVELYEPAMCCQSGVCGPSVDQQLIDVRENVRWAQAHGAEVARHNLSSDPDAFVSNPKVTGLMAAFGENALPVLVIDGEIAVHGRYPSREELAGLLDAKVKPIVEPAQSSGGYGRGGCC